MPDMPFLTWMFHKAVLLGAVWTVAANAQPLEWQTMVGEWRISQAYAKQPDAPVESLDVAFIEEGRFHPGGNWQALTAGWQPLRESVCKFSSMGEHEILYAVAVVESPEAASGILALGADDGVRAFWNGREAVRSDTVSCLFLDDHTGSVEVLKGDNILLIKLENWAGPAGFCARLLPHADTARRAAFATAVDTISGGAVLTVPDLSFDLLNRAGELVASHRCAGNRHRWAAWQRGSSRAGWHFYLPTEAEAFCERIRVWAPLDGSEPSQGERALLGEWPKAELLGRVLPLPAPKAAPGGKLRQTETTLTDEKDRPIRGAVFFDAVTGVVSPAEEKAPGVYLLPVPVVYGKELAFTAPGRTEGEVWLGTDGSSRALSKGDPAAVVLNLWLQDETGRPVAGAFGKLLRGEEEEAISVADAEGRLPLRMSAEQVTRLAGSDSVVVEIRAPGFAPVFFRPAEEQPEEEVETGDEALPATAAHLTLRRVPPLHIQFVNADSGVAITWEDAWAASQAPDAPLSYAKRDDRGIAIMVDGQGPGSRLLLVADGFIPQALEMDEKSWSAGRVVARLKPARPLKGVVLDTEGKPVRGAAAWFPEWMGVSLSGGWERTGSDGKFTIRTHAGVPVEIPIYASGYESIQVEMDPAKHTDTPLEVRLRAD